MNNRFQIISTVLPNQYAEGSPALITGGNLLRDDYTGNTLAQFCFQNISDCEIAELKIRITPFDASGKAVNPVVKYRYTALKASRDAYFGSKTAITIPSQSVQSLRICIDEIVLAGGETLDLTGTEFSPLGERLPLSALTGDEESARQYAIRYGEDCKYAPEELDGLWYCVCGAINHSDEKLCHSCRRALSFLRNVGVAALKDDSEKRVELEAETAVEEKNTHRNKKIKRITIAAISTVIVAAAIIALSIIPGRLRAEQTYNTALQLISDGELDSASALLAGLGDYEDAYTLLNEKIPLLKAEAVENAAETGDRSAFDYACISRSSVKSDEEARIALYQAAIRMYSSLANAEQYADRIENCEKQIAAIETQIKDDAYEAAGVLLSEGRYLEANAAYLAMDHYRDSDTLATEALYQRAVVLYRFASEHETKDVRATLSGETSVFMTDLTAKELGAGYIEDLQVILGADGLNTTLVENLEVGDGSLIDEIAKQFEILSPYKDSAELHDAVVELGNYTAEFYTLVAEGRLNEAYLWLQNYTGDVDDRGTWLTVLPAYANYCGNWELRSGDPTLLPLTTGKGGSPTTISVAISVADKTPKMTITAANGVVVELNSEFGVCNFKLPGSGNAIYYVYINSHGRFVYAKLINGTTTGACEYNKAK